MQIEEVSGVYSRRNAASVFFSLCRQDKQLLKQLLLKNELAVGVSGIYFSKVWSISISMQVPRNTS